MKVRLVDIIFTIVCLPLLILWVIGIGCEYALEALAEKFL